MATAPQALQEDYWRQQQLLAMQQQQAQQAQQPQPSTAQQVAGAAGQISGTALGGAAAQGLTGAMAGGGSSVAAPVLMGASMAPSTVAGVGAPAMGSASFGGMSVPMASYSGMAAPASSGWGASLAAAAPAIGAAGIGAATAHQAYDAWDKMQDASTSGAGSLKAGLLATGPVLGWAAPVVDFLGIKTGKHKDQYGRDAARSFMQEKGLLDDKFQLELADGTLFDMGQDGGFRYADGGRAHDIDWSKEGMGGIAAAANPLAALIAGGDKKLTSDIAGYFTRAATSSGDPRANILHFIKKAGLDHATLYGQIHLMSLPEVDEEGKEIGGPRLDKETADAYKNGLDQLYGVGHYKGKGGGFGTPDIQPGQEKPKAPAQQEQPQPSRMEGRPPATTQGSGAQKPVPKPAAQTTTPAPKPQQGSPFISSPKNQQKPGGSTESRLRGLFVAPRS